MKTIENLRTGCLAIILGIGLFIFGALFLSSFDFYINSSEVEGQVTSINTEQRSCSRRAAGGRRRSSTCVSYTAVVEYPTPQGNYTTDVSFGFLTSYEAGQKVEMLYDTRHPASAYPNTITGIWSGPLFMLALPFLFMLNHLKSLKERYF